MCNFFHLPPVFSPPGCPEAVPAPPSTNEKMVVDRVRGDDAGQGRGERDQGQDQG